MAANNRAEHHDDDADSFSEALLNNCDAGLLDEEENKENNENVSYFICSVGFKSAPQSILSHFFIILFQVSMDNTNVATSSRRGVIPIVSSMC